MSDKSHSSSSGGGGASHGGHHSSGGGGGGLTGKSACLPSCTTYPRCSCRLKNALKDKIKKKFDLKSFMTTTSSLAQSQAILQTHHHLSAASKDAKESEHLSSIRMLADLLEDNKICVADAVGIGAVERLNACLAIPALQNAALETLGVLLQAWLKFDRTTAHQQAIAAKGKQTNVCKNHAQQQSNATSSTTSTPALTTPSALAKKVASVAGAKQQQQQQSASSCTCCQHHTSSPLIGASACGSCTVCVAGGAMRFETWVQLNSLPTQPTPTPTQSTSGSTHSSNTTPASSALTPDDAASSIPTTAAVTPVQPSPPPSTLSPAPPTGTGALLLASALKLLRQPTTRKMAAYIVSHYSSIPAAALVLIHMEGAIQTLLDVYQSLSDSKDSQLLVHLSAILAGLCSKPLKATIPKLFPIVPVLLSRFKQCSNTLVVAYICTALGRLCDGQPTVAVEIMKFNIASYLLFLYYSAVERVKKKEKPRKVRPIIAYDDS